MKRYVRNLIQALLGNNPYRKEFNELSEKYEKAADNVRCLKDLYFASLEAKIEIESQIKVIQEATDKQNVTYQTLTENLRKRVFEYQEAIEQERMENNRLRRLLRRKDNKLDKA